MQITRQPSRKRVCADSTVSVADVQTCITAHLRDRSTTDLWSIIVPGPDGPRTWSFRSKPDGRWMARFACLAYDLVCDVCKNTKVLRRVLVPALEACILAGVVTNTSGFEKTKFIDNVDVTVRIVLSWYRQLKVSKDSRARAFQRLSEQEKKKVMMVMDRIELNADEAEAAAEDGGDGSESDVDMTFMVSFADLCPSPSSNNKARKESSLEEVKTQNAALHLLFDGVLKSTDSAAPSSAAPSGAAPSGSAPPGSAPSASAPSGSAAAESKKITDLDLLLLARNRKPAFMDTTAASGSKPKPKKAQAKAKAKAQAKAQSKAKAQAKAKAQSKAKAQAKAKAVVKPKPEAKAAPKKRPAAVAPDGAIDYVFMTYDKGKPTERIALCEHCGTKRGRQIIQVSGKALASEARRAIAQELMDMLVACKPLEDLTARKSELLSAAV